MGLAAIVQVIAGVIFVYILLSIVVTEVNALLARATNMRAKNLRSSINRLIEDPVIQAKVYTHPLIQLVKAETVAPTQRLSGAEAQKIVKKPVNAVDWIEPKTFVDVVLNTIKADSDQKLFGGLLNVIDSMPAGPERRGMRALASRIISSGQGMQELRKALPYVNDRRYRAALTDSINQIDEEISQLGLDPRSNVALLAGIGRIENTRLRSALSTVMFSASSTKAAQDNLEIWFNNAMSQATASYKAGMKKMSVLVALAFALVFNLDTFHIARSLWDDPAAREQLSSELSYAVQSGELQSQVDASAGAADEFSASGAESDDILGDAVEAGATIANQLQDIQDLRLPIGWRFAPADEQYAAQSAATDANNLWNYFPQNNPEGWLSLLGMKFLGIAATVLAAAQGAPFWFGLVNRVLRR